MSGEAHHGPSRRAERIRALQLRTRNAIKGPPTHVIARRARDVLMDDALAYEVIDLALRIGEAMLSVGVSASSTTANVLRIAAAYGLTSCQVEVTFTAITLSVVRDDGEPVSATRMAKVRTSDFSRLAELDELVAAIQHSAAEQGQGGPDLLPSQALERLDLILDEPHPYRRWIVTLALAGMAASVAGLLGGGPIAAIVAALTTAGIDRLLKTLNGWAIPSFFQQAAGAALATCVAVALLAVERFAPFELSTLRPSVVVASGIVVLLAGLAWVGSAEDAIAGFYLTASARVFEVVMLTAGIVVGIGGILALARRFDLPIVILDVTTDGMPLILQALLAAAIAGCFGLASYARPAAVLVAASAAVAAYAIYMVLGSLGFAAASAAGIAAFTLGAIADVAGSRTGIPPMVIATAGITPLLPGLAIYHGMFVMIDSSQAQGLAQLTEAATIGLALAAGVALGGFVASPLRAGFDRYDRRVRQRAGNSRAT